MLLFNRWQCLHCRRRRRCFRILLQLMALRLEWLL
jgi:hypothetical protein